MSRVLRFFPRQTLVGDNGPGTTYYSEIFEVTQEYVIDVEIIYYADSSATAALSDVKIQHTTDPTLDQWADTSISFTLAGGTSDTDTFSGMLNYVRAKVSVASTQSGTFELTGVVREST